MRDTVMGLDGNVYQEAFNQVVRAVAAMVSEALPRDFDTLILAAAFPGWPVAAGKSAFGNGQ